MKERGYSTDCYICMDRSYARMRLPLCTACPKCGGHIAADDTTCDDCGWDTYEHNHRYHPHISRGLHTKLGGPPEILAVRCPITGELAVNTERVVEFSSPCAQGQGGHSLLVKAR